MVAVLFKAIAPKRVPPRLNPNFVDNIFDSALVIGAARVLLLAAAGLLLVFAAYTVSSMVVRMKNGEWLKVGGPFKAHVREAADLLEESSAYYQALVDQAEINDQLLERLRERDAELEIMYDENKALRDQSMDARDRDH